MNPRFAPFVLVLSGCLAAPVTAQNGALVMLDSTDFELVARVADVNTVSFMVPARLSAANVSIRRWSISQNGRLIDRNGSSIGLETASDGSSELAATFDLSKLDAPGGYLVTIEFVVLKPASSAAQSTSTQLGTVPAGNPASADPPAGSTVPQPVELEQTVQLKLTKPAAELSAATPVRIERTIYFPSVFGWFDSASVLEPTMITLEETGQKSWVKIDPAVWHVVLRQGDNTAEPHRLLVRLPERIDGGGQADATVALDGAISVGTKTGTLTIRAPQLVGQTVDFAVTVVSHLWAIWLLPTILAGTALGWYFRNRLDARRARLVAIVPAEQELGRLDDLVNATVDRTYRGRLERARGELARTVEEKAATPESIAAATTKVAAERESIVKAIDDQRERLRTALQAWTRPGTVTEPLPEEAAPELEALRRAVERLMRAFEDGLLADVEKGLNDDLPTVTRPLKGSLSNWQRQFSDLKANSPLPWPEVLQGKLSSLTADGEKFAQELAAGDTAESLWKALISAATLLVRLKQDIFGTVRDRALATAKSAEEMVRRFGPTVEAKVQAIKRAAAAMPDAITAGTPNAAVDFTDALNVLRTAIAEGLKAVWKKPEPLPGLEQGNFSQALQALESVVPQAEIALGGEAPAPTGTRAVPNLATALQAMRQVTTAQVIAKWTVVLEAGPATVSEPVTVRARLIVPLGTDQPEVTINWFRAGILVARDAPGTFERSFAFAEAGPASIGVLATDGTGASASAELVLQVHAVHGARAIGFVRETLDRVEMIQNVASGAIIVVGGWLIFSPSFIGTFPELFAAFLWGFSVDVGTAKVRELTESLKGLKVPVSIPN